MGNVREKKGNLEPFGETNWITLQETNISPEKSILKMIFLFPRCRWDMLIPWRVSHCLPQNQIPGRSPDNFSISAVAASVCGTCLGRYLKKKLATLQ